MQSNVVVIIFLSHYYLVIFDMSSVLILTPFNLLSCARISPTWLQCAIWIEDQYSSAHHDSKNYVDVLLNDGNNHNTFSGTLQMRAGDHRNAWDQGWSPSIYNIDIDIEWPQLSYFERKEIERKILAISLPSEKLGSEKVRTEKEYISVWVPHDLFRRLDEYSKPTLKTADIEVCWKEHLLMMWRKTMSRDWL